MRTTLKSAAFLAGMLLATSAYAYDARYQHQMNQWWQEENQYRSEQDQTVRAQARGQYHDDISQSNHNYNVDMIDAQRAYDETMAQCYRVYANDPGNLQACSNNGKSSWHGATENAQHHRTNAIDVARDVLLRGGH